MITFSMKRRWAYCMTWVLSLWLLLYWRYRSPFWLSFIFTRTEWNLIKIHWNLMYQEMAHIMAIYSHFFHKAWALPLLLHHGHRAPVLSSQFLSDYMFLWKLDVHFKVLERNSSVFFSILTSHRIFYVESWVCDTTYLHVYIQSVLIENHIRKWTKIRST